MNRLTSAPVAALAGTAPVPGDKSISHRALLLGALAVGETRIAGLSRGDDVARTAGALRRLGVAIDEDGDGGVRVHGVGVGGLAEPDGVLDLGNSGTGARLLMGAVASHPFTSVFTGDESLCRRPMARVVRPLERIGAQVVGRSGDRLPLAVVGTAHPLPIRYVLPVPSAQVKSAVLLAGLNAPGETTVVEPAPTRDHSERMLAWFGATLRTEETAEGRAVTLVGQPELAARDVDVPGDPSSAAFLLTAALVVPGARVTVPNVCINPLRTGLLDTLREMGADLRVENRRVAGGDEVADLTAAAGPLRGVEVPPGRAPSMIDEYPILAVAAACAEGTTTMRGLAELRVKESDRLAAMAAGLAACGVRVEELPDGLVVHGGGRPPGGAAVRAELDHRIAMAFLVLGMAAAAPVTVDDAAMIDTSFPGFVALMAGLGGRIGGAAG